MPEFPAVAPERGWADALNNAIELKPNVFGVGVNLNAIMEMIGERIVQTRRSHQRPDKTV
jgi:hypothetical protein